MEKKPFTHLKPFKIHDKIYFVGNERVSVHIIESKCGLIMIDTGYPDMLEVITENMKTLGLDIKDICAIFHSHGHIDHFGCTIRLKEESGAKTYISRIDNDIVNGKYDLSWAKELGLEKVSPFNCDVLVEDGDVFDFDDISVRCVSTPGHTDGVISFFITVRGEKENVIAAMHGGIGRNTLAKEYLEKNGFSFEWREKYRESLKKVKEEHVDIVLGNHPGQSDTLGKLNKLHMGAKNIIDVNEWSEFLENAEKQLDEMIADEKKFKNKEYSKEKLNKDVKYDFSTLYEKANEEMIAQQTKRDQIITLFLTLFSIIVPFSLSAKGIGFGVKGLIFTAVAIIGIMFSLIIIRYRIYKEAYWICCQAITNLMSFTHNKLDKETVQAVYYRCMKKKGDKFVKKNNDGECVGFDKKMFFKKNIFSGETIYFLIHAFIVSVLLALGVGLMISKWRVAAIIISVLLALCSFTYHVKLFFDELIGVYDVLVDDTEASFNKTFSKAWFLHFYVE